MIRHLSFIIGLTFASMILALHVYRKIAACNNILDAPRPGHHHTQATIKGSGLTGVLIMVVILMMQNQSLGVMSLPLIVPCLVLGMLSFIDDLVGIKNHYRLICQLIVSAYSVHILGYLPGIDMENTWIELGYIGYWIAVPAMTFAMNAFNFMDGTDGFACTQALILSLLFSYLGMGTPIGNLSLILFAIALPLLIDNWSPARSFIGDVGSTFFGYWFAVLALYGQNNHDISIISGMYGFACFGYDVIIVLLKKLHRGKPLFARHFWGLHHVLVRQKGLSAPQSCLVLVAINTCYIILLMLQSDPKHPHVMPLLIIGILHMLIRQYLERSTWISNHKSNIASP